MNRKTIKKSVQFKGVGIHSAQESVCTLYPSKDCKGISIYREDCDTKWWVHPNSIQLSAIRATRLGTEVEGVSTPEHLLAALALAGVTDCEISVSAPELPIMDGAASQFLESILNTGTETIDDELTPVLIQDVLIVENESSRLIVEPSDRLIIEYHAYYPHSFIGTQQAIWDSSSDNGVHTIAPARTYAFEHEIEQLQSNGLGLGGSLNNTLVITDSGFMNEPMFENECARHKILDIIGDFMVLGRPVIGKITGHGSGHQLNLEMVKKLNSTILH